MAFRIRCFPKNFIINILSSSVYSMPAFSLLAKDSPSYLPLLIRQIREWTSMPYKAIVLHQLYHLTTTFINSNLSMNCSLCKLFHNMYLSDPVRKYKVNIFKLLLQPVSIYFLHKWSIYSEYVTDALNDMFIPVYGCWHKQTVKN